MTAGFAHPHGRVGEQVSSEHREQAAQSRCDGSMTPAAMEPALPERNEEPSGARCQIGQDEQTDEASLDGTEASALSAACLAIVYSTYLCTRLLCSLPVQMRREGHDMTAQT